ncbi:hypothetical protein OG2516_17041 [Oceanicola granulosus HTCC2516]|uniref:DUF2332 domain-containing protein n=1 Tax=Oceanicola granulosus (strain ATCC BAA-861 / DSM 15982 / KCTC 12143 / HTCC2516) TaxID=314256 RepID=Q2CFN5_OCEGH|nr:DUF2332 family protein [Oceanicola granulosus]EAR51447.1 hypothetical protein OG2516_17041 [Oceanicola granulosus HTCC2516]
MSHLRAALRHQARSCAMLGSPFMERLLLLLADRLAPGTPVTDRLFGWEGDIGSSGDSVPLRLAGALHGLVLGGHAGLRAVYPPEEATDEALWAAVEAALRDEAEVLNRWLDSPPQTNEVRRSVALVAAAQWLTARWNLPFDLYELGASAGLNLGFDRYAVETPLGSLGPAAPALTLRPDWTGALPHGPAARVAARRGVDLRPLDPAQDRLRLLAYLWPDQPERRTLTEAAIAAHTATVDAGDAAGWLEARLAPAPGRLALVYHTIAWQYFPATTRQRARAAIEAAAASATDDAPLVWLGMEADGRQPGAALSATLYPGGHTHELGRIDFHGRWICWTAGPAAP